VVREVSCLLQRSSRSGTKRFVVGFLLLLLVSILISRRVLNEEIEERRIGSEEDGLQREKRTGIEG